MTKSLAEVDLIKLGLSNLIGFVEVSVKEEVLRTILFPVVRIWIKFLVLSCLYFCKIAKLFP